MTTNNDQQSSNVDKASSSFAPVGSYQLKPMLTWSVREIIHGQLWPVVIALSLIIACVFGLSALGDRMDDVIAKQSSQALTADLIYRSANPIPQTLKEQTKDLTQSEMVRFSTMAFSDEQMKLIRIKAVDSLYPLQGELLLDNDQSTKHHVEKNELWLEPQLMQDLEVSIGDNVGIGDADFTVTGVIATEPGLSFNPFNQIPTAYIHRSDLDKTGAIVQGSRVQYRLFMNADESRIEQIKDQVELTPSDRWVEQDGESRAAKLFERTEQYLSLTVAVVILMSALTLVLTCQHYVDSRRQTIAMLKSIGARRGWLLRWQWIQISILFFISIVIGTIVGIGLEVALRIPLVDLLPEDLPGYGLKPFFIALLTCISIGMPALGIPLVRLLKTPATQVMGQDFHINTKQIAWLFVLPLALMGFAFGHNQLVWLVFAGIVVAFILLGLICLGIIKLIQKLKLNASAKLATSRILRSPVTSGLQFGALSLSFMLMAIIWLVRVDLLSDWERTLPPDAPNVFAMNIAPDALPDYLETLEELKLPHTDAFPIIRGRLTQINSLDAQESTPNAKEVNALHRELNFTFAKELPSYNQQIEGRWGEDNAVSIESEIAAQLGIKLGDNLTFVINSQSVSATVTSIREVSWRDLKPNFYFIFSDDVLQNMPSTYLLSFKTDENTESLKTLSRVYPTVSLIDLRSMIEKIQMLLTQIIWSISLLAALAVVAGILLIFTLLRLSLMQRQQEIQLYRTLGASSSRLKQTLWFEYGILAFVASIVACLGAEVTAASIMHFAFELSAKIHYGLWLVLPIFGLMMIGCVVFSLKRKLFAPLYQGRIGL